VDNLDLVFDRLKKHELNSLRAFLMKAGAPILIGASVYPPAQTQDYRAPFYDHFKTHYLARLSLEEMREVLLRLAERSGNKIIPARIDVERGRLHALHALTGGNPRTTVILFQIFARGFSQDAYHDLEALLDWMTPLYKARFEELSDQAQVIVSALATIWEPATSARICEKTRLRNSQVSPQLDRLKKDSIIEEVTVDPEDRVGALPAGHSPRDRTGYQLAERFFNIWCLMRQATRRDKRNLTFLTRFIECVHTPAERDAMARDLLTRRRLSREQRIYGLALESAVANTGLRYELHDHVENEFIEAKRRLEERIDEIIDSTEIPQHKWAFAELRDRLVQAVPTDAGVTGEDFANTVLGSPAMVERREAIAASQLDSLKVRELMQAAADEDQVLIKKHGAETVSWFKKLLQRGVLADYSDSNHAEAWGNLGDLFQDDLERYEDAEAAYRKAIELDPNNEISWNQLGLILGDCLGRGSEAAEAFRKAIALQPDDALAPTHNLIAVVRDQLNGLDEARHLAAQLPSTESKTLQAGLCLHPALFAAYEDNWGVATQHLGKALDLISDQSAFPSNTSDDWMRASAVLLHLGFGEKLLSFLRDRGDDQRLRPWYEALRALLRGDRRYLRNIPAEMQEVAGKLYDEIALRLKNLPESTRRWSSSPTKPRVTPRRKKL
jgi:tetratricopeptide (TPR) repeat protein